MKSEFFKVLPIEAVPGAMLVAYAWEGGVHIYSLFEPNVDEPDQYIVAGAMMPTNEPKRILAEALPGLAEDFIIKFIQIEKETVGQGLRAVPAAEWFKTFELEEGEVILFKDRADGKLVELISTTADSAYQLSKFAPNAPFDGYTPLIASGHMDQFIFKAAAQMFIEQARANPLQAIIIPETGSEKEPEYVSLKEPAELSWLQEKVGGFIEFVNMQNEPDLAMICNENGTYTLKRNKLAEAVYFALTGIPGAVLHGPIILGTNGGVIN